MKRAHRPRARLLRARLRQRDRLSRQSAQNALLKKCLIAFSLGVARETIGVGWVHFTQSGRVGAAMLVSLAGTLVTVAGMALSIKSRWWVTACYAGGEAVGTGLGTLVRGLLG